MKTIKELNKKQVQILADLESGAMDVTVGREMNSAARNIVSIQKLQIEYAVARRKQPDIEFMNS